MSNPERIIGEYHGSEAGPCVIVVAGIHGNEPAGVQALERVFQRLAEGAYPLKGDFIGLRGNLAGLARNVRFVAKDLNRIWTRERLEKRNGGSLASEESELLALEAVIERTIDQARGPVLIIDLHTSSAPSSPFLCFGEGQLLEGVYQQLPFPAIIDQLHCLDGMLVKYFSNRGHATFAFEAGEHHAIESIEIHEAALWLSLVGSGSLEDRRLFPGEAARQRLARVEGPASSRLALIYRHGISPGDQFKMRPGFQNFDPVEQGQVLGEDRNGAIRAPAHGRLFLPLYQVVGEDGFFIVQEQDPVLTS